MKNIMLIITLLFSSCSGFTSPSEMAEKNLKLAWRYDQCGNHRKAIAMCTYWIEYGLNSNVDKIHYIVARSNFHLSDNDNDGYDTDFEVLRYLAEVDSQCAEELFSCYEIKF